MDFLSIVLVGLLSKLFSFIDDYGAPLQLAGTSVMTLGLGILIERGSSLGRRAEACLGATRFTLKNQL